MSFGLPYIRWFGGRSRETLGPVVANQHRRQGIYWMDLRLQHPEADHETRFRCRRHKSACEFNWSQGHKTRMNLFPRETTLKKRDWIMDGFQEPRLCRPFSVSLRRSRESRRRRCRRQEMMIVGFIEVAWVRNAESSCSGSSLGCHPDLFELQGSSAGRVLALFSSPPPESFLPSP